MKIHIEREGTEPEDIWRGFGASLCGLFGVDMDAFDRRRDESWDPVMCKRCAGIRILAASQKGATDHDS